jgi:acetylornithine deacetylase/succinyl-diaminopimelate desuccinylase-like protein
MRDPERAFDELVSHLQALIRLRTVNPPGDEIVAARYLADVLTAGGLTPEILEPVPGRGSVVARLHGDGTGGEPLLLLSHLDVVPADEQRWSQDPFGGHIVDGLIYGRGAVDMKQMVAMELQVVLELAAEARDAGLDPRTDPVPGLCRDVIFAATADEEAGGTAGMRWLVESRPELFRAAACLNEAGGVTVEVAGRRFYPIQVAEKGFRWYRIVVRGSAGHASLPRDDNALLLAAQICERLSVAGPARPTALMSAAVEAIADALPAREAALCRGLLDADAQRAEEAIERLCAEPSHARALRALLRDTVSVDVIHAGLKTNVIPGVAEIEIDCRILPGTTSEDLLAELRRRIGEELWARCEVEPLLEGAPVEQPLDHPMLALIDEVLRRHDPEALPLPIMAPFATDAKSTTRLGIPTYGFSPLRLAPSEPFLDLFHGDDERVPLSALRFGLPVLDEVVRRYCG